jgi:hypothetical protein
MKFLQKIEKLNSLIGNTPLLEIRYTYKNKDYTSYDPIPTYKSTEKYTY